RPADPALALRNRHVVDARLPAPHVAIVVELPLLVAVGAPPAAALVVPLVLEADRDPVSAEGPQLLPQGVVELLRPLPAEEGDDLVAAVEELVAVAPLRVRRVRGGDAF